MAISLGPNVNLDCEALANRRLDPATRFAFPAFMVGICRRLIIFYALHSARQRLIRKVIEMYLTCTNLALVGIV